MKINREPIAQKIQELIKAKLVEKGLVDTGKLLNSIFVKPSTTNDGFDIIAEDYYTYLDEEYNISKEVFESAELSEFMTNYLAKEIEKNIN